MSELEYLDEFELDMAQVEEHYKSRKIVAKTLRNLLASEHYEDYANLALGISDPLGNYSASEHQLGPQVLANNSVSSVCKLARKFVSGDLGVSHLPRAIYEANLPYLKISVGSEMASLLMPAKYWVGNVRTIYSHLVIKHEGDWERANEELELYRIEDTSSEMAYKIWRDIYLSMEHSLNVIERIAAIRASQQDVKVGKQRHIWVDAVCNSIYEE